MPAVVDQVSAVLVVPVTVAENCCVPPETRVAEVGEIETVTEVNPIPESEILCGLPAALSLIVTVPVLGPTAVGVNFTLIVQLAPAATGGPQVPSPAKLKSPLTVKLLLKFRVALPVFARVTNCTALVVPTS